jgi:predicted enzyme related to lactoylglutathione lyase
MAIIQDPTGAMFATFRMKNRRASWLNSIFRNRFEICWRELATKDLPRRSIFTQRCFGWTLEQTKSRRWTTKRYVMDGTAYGGMMQIDENWPPEVAITLESRIVAVAKRRRNRQKIIDNGGSIRVPAFDAPGVGRISIAGPTRREWRSR